MSTKLTELRRWFVREYADWEMGVYYQSISSTKSNYQKRALTPINRVRFIYEMIPVWVKHDIIGRALCRFFGHGTHFHDASYIGPDSGTESFYCDRCGFSWSYTYY